MSRGFFVGGNWKMNGSKSAIDGICDNLNATAVPENTRGTTQQTWAFCYGSVVNTGQTCSPVVTTGMK